MSVGRIVTASGELSAPRACAICSRESSVGRRQVLARCGRSTRAARGVRASHEHSMIEGSFVPSFD